MYFVYRVGDESARHIGTEVTLQIVIAAAGKAQPTLLPTMAPSIEAAL